jgi:hypothetical protein
MRPSARDTRALRSTPDRAARGNDGGPGNRIVHVGDRLDFDATASWEAAISGSGERNALAEVCARIFLPPPTS